MKTNARVVVVGGGMMGASLLYHLALEGWTDTVLIEKGELTSGSTWHAAGQCPSITGSYNLAKIHAYSNSLYPTLEKLTGQYVSWHPCGGLRLANNKDELAWLKFVQGYSKSIGFSMDIVGLDEIKRLNPFLTTDKVRHPNRRGRDPKIMAFFTMVDRRRKLHGQVISDLVGVRPEVLTTEVPASTVFEQMGVRRAPVECFAPRSQAAVAYRSLWEEVNGSH